MSATTERGAELPALTGVRGIAAFAVFLSHLHFVFPPGRTGRGFTAEGGKLQQMLEWGSTGVSLFFVLSGFVLAWTWTDPTATPVFWRRRFARVWPLHAVVWLGFVLMAVVDAAPRAGAGPMVASLLLVQCWIPGLGWANAVNPVAWTLSCEMFFYLAFPFLIRPVRRLSRVALVRSGVAITIAAAVVTIVVLEPHGVTVSTFPPVRIWEFGLGIVLATALRQGWLRSAPPLSWSLVVLLASLAATTWLTAVRGPALVLTSLSFFAIIWALARKDLGRSSPGILGSSVARRAGEWSYAFYLVQLLPLAVLRWVGWSPDTWLESVGTILVWFVVTVSAAAVLHHTVERPAVRAVRRLDVRVVRRAPA